MKNKSENNKQVTETQRLEQHFVSWIDRVMDDG